MCPPDSKPGACRMSIPWRWISTSYNPTSKDHPFSCRRAEMFVVSACICNRAVFFAPRWLLWTRRNPIRYNSCHVNYWAADVPRWTKGVPNPNSSNSERSLLLHCLAVRSRQLHSAFSEAFLGDLFVDFWKGSAWRPSYQRYIFFLAQCLRVED